VTVERRSAHLRQNAPGELGDPDRIAVKCVENVFPVPTPP
jgi:hypothetical protein